MNLELTDDQADVLRTILDTAWRDLRHEIADTDSPRFRRELKEHEGVVRDLLERLGGPRANPV
jgi:transposase